MSKQNKSQITSGKKAVIFARTVSMSQCTPEIEVQLQDCRKYAKSHGLEVVKEFTSIGGAGREQFDVLVRQLRLSNWGAIVVEKTDRLYRHLPDLSRVDDLVEELGIEIHLVKEGQIIARHNKTQGSLVNRMFTLLSRYYMENLREEIKKGQMIKAKSGRYPGRAPFGYRNDPKSRLIEIDLRHGPIVTTIFELYKSGSHSISSVSKNISETTGHAITRSRLRNILRNRFYIAFFTWNGVEHRGVHEPLVDCNTFHTVQRELSA